MAANKIDLVKPLVPRPPDTFTGRDAEIALLRRFMSRQRLVVIKGIGGIGKTALALAHLDEIRRAHPQRDIRFIRCSEHEGVAALFGETQSADAPMAFIHEINAADAVLLLDDVHLLPADQAGLLVRLLQTYLTGHALLTTREDLPLPAIDRVDLAQVKLEGLGPDAGAALLADLLALHPTTAALPEDDARTLVGAVGGHPLLLRLVASLLVTRAVDVAALRGTGLPVAMRDELLARVVGDMPPPERAVLEVLALARAPLPDPALAALAGVPDAAARLASLERKLLVEREGPDRMLIHHLLADHVQATAATERRQALHGALARWWLAEGQPARAFHHFIEAGDAATAAEIFQTVAGSLCASAQYDLLMDSVKRLEDANIAVPDRVRVAQANALSMLGRSAESLALLRGVAEGEAEADGAIEALSALAGAHLNAGDFARALAVYERALALSEERGAVDETSKCLNYTALIRGYRGEMSVAWSMLDRSLVLARQSRSRPARAHALRIRATLFALVGAYDEALSPARESLGLATVLESTRLTCWARYAEAMALNGRGEHELARTLLEENLRDGDLAGGQHIQAFARQELGAIAAARGDLETAARHLEASIRAFEYQGYTMGVAMTELRLAELLRARGQGETARATLLRVAAVAAEFGNPRLEAEAHLGLAGLSLDEGASDSARTEIETARTILGALELPSLMAEALLLAAEERIGGREGAEAARLIDEALAMAGPSAAVKRRADALRPHLPDAAGRKGNARKSAPDARLETRLAAALSQRLRVITADGAVLRGDEEVASLRQAPEQWALFLDAPSRTLQVEGKGEVPIFRRPVLQRLLVTLIRNHGRVLPADELVPLVWGFPYEGESSALEVRKAISRVRDLIEVDRTNPRWVRRHEARLEGRGGYSFQAAAPFCAILEDEEPVSGS